MKPEATRALLRDITTTLHDNDRGTQDRLVAVAERALDGAAPGLLLRDTWPHTFHADGQAALDGWVTGESDEAPWEDDGTEPCDYLANYDDYKAVAETYFVTDYAWMHRAPNDFLRKVYQETSDVIDMLVEWDWPHELAEHYAALSQGAQPCVVVMPPCAD